MSMSGAILSLCLLGWAGLLVERSEGIPINNGVVGSPEVECLNDRVKMVFTTENEFRGIVYAKGFYLDEGCNRPNAGNGASAAVEYEFDQCGVTRRRSLEPKGVFVTGVVVIQFHPFVLTKIDRAIRFQCFYMEADKTVDTDLEVSAITTEFQTFQVPMPVCRYEILDGPQGNPVKFATIGMKVYHTWTCDTDTENIFCMEVYGCYVGNAPIASADEDETAIRLLDDDGCALDGNLLQNPDYNDADEENARGLSAQRETHVFKYADRPALFFNCQIRIGVRDPGTGCIDYRESSGGQCQDAPLTRRKRRAGRAAGRDMGLMDVVPEHPLYIADLELSQGDIPAGLFANNAVSHVRPARPSPSASKPLGTFCVSSTFFGVLVSFTAVFLVAAVSMAVILCVRGQGKH